jgi:AraC-like DNA-binding protein
MESPLAELKWVQDALKSRVDRWTRTDSSYTTPIAGLSLHRDEATGRPHGYVRETALCLILQGSKRVTMGSEVLVYDANHLLLASLDVPVVAEVLEASPQQPYLSLVLTLDQAAIAEFLVTEALPPAEGPVPSSPLLVVQHSLPLLLSVLRLVSLLDDPGSLPVLAPLIHKEILYLLLVGNTGPHLRQTVAAGAPGAQISRAIGWLRDNYKRPLRVGDLASLTHMSTTAFHSHFKRLTAMSPVQYQKWLRLQEARRLMLADRLDVSRAAYEVGYESRSQFSREYRRQFDSPPAKDIQGLRSRPARTPEGAAP